MATRTPIESLIRKVSRCGMTDGTVMVIEFISGFELFNTRAYHNYETWAQGWRVHGLGCITEAESLEDAVLAWVSAVNGKRAGEEVPPRFRLELRSRQGEPFRAPMVLDDWIIPDSTQKGVE